MLLFLIIINKMFLLYFMLLVHVTHCKECNVLDYGAKGDGKTLDTKSIQNAINNCSESTNEMNTIIFPSKYNFLSYPFKIIKSNTTLQLDGTLTCPMDYKNWPNNGHDYIHFITNTQNINNIIISGNGLINGNGYYWYSLYKNKQLKYERPWLIDLHHITNVRISGITLLNSPMFHIFIGEGDTVEIYDINITVTGDPVTYDIAPNTDGIDIASKNVHIYNCFVQNGDDSYCLKDGAYNVVIENSTSKYGMSCEVNSEKGNYNQPKIQNAIFRNMIAIQTAYGIRLKSGESPGNMYNGSFNNITFKNITFIDVQKGIDINVYNESINRMEYYNYGYTKITNIIFQDIKGTFTKYPGYLDCSDSPPCTGLVFTDISLKNNGGDDTWQCSNNVYGSVSNVSPSLNCLNNTM
eukprot:247864_1